MNLAHGSYYFDLKSCGIGWHGDTERRKVVAIRLGESMSMKWCWFHECMPVSTPVCLQLAHGDVYIMSEKSVGQDWRSKSHVTLRHSAGAAKFTSLAGFKQREAGKKRKVPSVSAAALAALPSPR